jgi:hypothetical protein
MTTWKWQCMFVIVVTSNVFGETICYKLIINQFVLSLFFCVSFVFIIACCVLKFFITFPNCCKCGVNSCVSTTKCLCVNALCYNLLHKFSSLHISMLHFIVAMGPICLGLLPYFDWLFVFFFLFGLCFFVFFFTLYFWWMGSYPWFLYIHGFFICNKFDVQKTLIKILSFFCFFKK